MVLNWASEYGLSFEVRGRECERRTPRSTSISDTGFEVMAPPRSAWMVWLDSVAGDRGDEEIAGPGPAPGCGDEPAGDVAGVDVEDDIALEPDAFDGSF